MKLKIIIFCKGTSEICINCKQSIKSFLFMYSFVEKLVVVSGSVNTPPTIATEISLPCLQQTFT